MQNICFLCASDERVVVDVKSNPDLFKKVESCLSSKKLEKQSVPNICYKCAYEVDQCSNFIKNCKILRGIKIKRNCCCLCQEPGKKGRIFDICKEKDSITGPLEKISGIFNDDLSSNLVVLICLHCRYHLDVLYDLRVIYEASKNVTINGAGFRDETKTEVIRRKTTNQVKLELQTPSDTDSDSSTMVRGKKTRQSSKSRECERCKCTVEDGMDMFRFHRTGQTVCKSCWTKEDHNRPSSLKKTRPKTADTKNCTVFLKDVLNNDLSSDNMPYKVEKDEYGNSTYIVTAESSETESSPLKKPKISKTQQGKSKTLKKTSKRLQSSSISSDSDERRVTRSTRSSSKDPKVATKSSVKSEQSNDEEKRTMRPRMQKRKNEVLIDEPRPKRTRGNSASRPESSNSTVKPTVQKKKQSAKKASVSMDSVDTSSYTCANCDLGFETKLLCCTHELTHSKNLEVKLYRVKSEMPPIIPEDPLEEETEQEVNSPVEEASNLAEKMGSIALLAIEEEKSDEVDTCIETIVEKNVIEESVEKSEENKEIEENSETNVGVNENTESETTPTLNSLPAVDEEPVAAEEKEEAAEENKEESEDKDQEVTTEIAEQLKDSIEKSKLEETVDKDELTVEDVLKDATAEAVNEEKMETPIPETTVEEDKPEGKSDTEEKQKSENIEDQENLENSESLSNGNENETDNPMETSNAEHKDTSNENEKVDENVDEAVEKATEKVPKDLQETDENVEEVIEETTNDVQEIDEKDSEKLDKVQDVLENVLEHSQETIKEMETLPENTEQLVKNSSEIDDSSRQAGEKECALKELKNSADMPSLDPLLDDATAEKSQEVQSTVNH